MKKVWYVLLFIVVFSCREKERIVPLFTLISPDSTGIDFRNDVIPTAEFNMYTYRNFYNGGGVGIGDINNDGLADLFFCGNLVDNKLYLNKGNFQFEDITETAGVASENIWSTGVSFADVNGDGWLDIYVCKSGQPGGAKRHNELFINNGDLTFTEQAKEYGIADEGFSSHAAFFDYDGDADLDLYLLNNSFRSVGGYDMRPGLRDIRDTLGGNKLYRNNTVENRINPGKKQLAIYEDVSEQAGIYGSSIGFGLGVTIGDIDRDGAPDIYVSNDFFERDYLYINQKDGTFKEDLVNQMREISLGSMGADMADINNDGLPEVFVTEMLPRSDARYKTKMTFETWDKYQLAVRSGYHHQFGRNTLQLNNGNQTFSEIGRLAGVHATDWSWSALIADFDNDGLKDIYVSNGIYKDLLDQDYIHFYANDPEITEGIRNRDPEAVLKLIEKIPSEPISNFAFRNNGDLTFADYTEAWGLAFPGFSNGAAYGDLDNDGDLDLVVNNCNMPPFILQNNANNYANNYLQISLVGDGFNTFAVGAQVTIKQGAQLLYQELSPMRGFQSCTDYKMTFGLGQTDTIEHLQVLWPDGRESVLRSIPANQHLILKQSDSQPKVETDLKPAAVPLLEEDRTLRIPYRHQENDFVDFDRDRLIFHMISSEGPKVCTGDVNNDGLTDIYLGGASGQAGQLLIQQVNGQFSISNAWLFQEDYLSEDIGATFFDADGDGDLDLYVASGGNEFQRKNLHLADRLYLNQGDGQFVKADNAFNEKVFESSSCVIAADFDLDGDQDLFVGTRLVPGIYGVPVSGYLWRNDGHGYFENVTASLVPALKDLGLITDALWLDINQDGLPDLIVVGEWMPVTVLINTGQGFTNETEKSGFSKTNGLWNCIEAADLDRDGHPDLVLGNHGLNTRLKASINFPVTMYINDFDNNKMAEQIVTVFNGPNAYPLVLRTDLVMQIPSLKKKYLFFENYKEQTIENIFAEKDLRTAAKVEVTNTRTSIAWNNGNGTFELKSLPVEAQFAPVHAILLTDLDNDQDTDIILGGNFHRSKPELGKYDASYGLVLINEGDRLFKPLGPKQSGLNLHGEVRDKSQLKVQTQEIILIARTNDTPVLLRKGK